jgi:hypothetical protein
LSRSGQRENENALRENFVRLSNYPTQAKDRLEWGTAAFLAKAVVQLQRSAVAHSSLGLA